MPSQRRLRFFFVVILAVVVTILFFSSSKRQTTRHDPRTINDFFGKTVNGLDQRHKGGGQVVMGGKVENKGKGSSTTENLKDHDGDGSVDKDDEILAQQMANRLRAAEQQAKDQANAKSPLRPDSPINIVGVGSSANGQKKGKNRISKHDTDTEDISEKRKGRDEEEDDVKDRTGSETSKAEVVLQQILKRSPVVIFSKTFCPYSKRAKGILLDKYIIEPAPYVVELNEHKLGPDLQNLLLEKTGRRTVPNIMVNGESIGGNDEITELDTRKTLIDKFKSIGGKKISMKERFIGNAKDKAP